MSDALKDETYERFMMLFTVSERSVRAFVRSLLLAEQDVDDVMQEVGLACWRKFDHFDSQGAKDDFVRWCCVIGRLEVLRFRRKCARDRLVLSEETIDLLAADGETRLERSLAERKALELCLSKLEEPEQRLLLCIHTQGESVAKLATEWQQSARRLYSKLNALRDLLSECVNRSLATEDY